MPSTNIYEMNNNFVNENFLKHDLATTFILIITHSILYL